MRNKAAAWCAQRVFRIMAVTAWLYTLPVVGVVVIQRGFAWGLFAGFVGTPALAVIVGVLATDKVSRPLRIDWETEVFRRDIPSVQPVLVAADESSVYEKEPAVI